MPPAPPPPLDPRLYTLQTSKLRSTIAKFHISTHSLEIERGRYAKPKTRKKGYIYWCDHEAEEDEFHFFIKCPLYQEATKMYAVYNTEIGSINVLSDVEKFNNVL